MGKKKFTDGLNDLFYDNHEPREGSSVTEISVQHPQERKSHHHVKSFAHDLDALLQEAMEESLGRMEANAQRTTASSKSKTRMGSNDTGNITGLDALIRETIDVQDFTKEEESGVKRLTVAMERAKLEKLKTIARLENAYLKDILVELIDEYIVEYTRDKGVSL